MNNTWEWCKERWWEFQVSDGKYGRYPMSFILWVIVVYALAIERMPFLEAIFTSMTLFAVLFVGVYIPANVVVGHFFHRREQMPTEARISVLANPYIWMLQPGRQIILQKYLVLKEKLWERLANRFHLFNSAEERALWNEYIEMLEFLEKGGDLRQWKK